MNDSASKVFRLFILYFYFLRQTYLEIEKTNSFNANI